MTTPKWPATPHARMSKLFASQTVNCWRKQTIQPSTKLNRTRVTMLVTESELCIYNLHNVPDLPRFFIFLITNSRLVEQLEHKMNQDAT